MCSTKEGGIIYHVLSQKSKGKKQSTCAYDGN